MMTTWKRGRALSRRSMRGRRLPLDMFLADIAHEKPQRVAGTAVFMTSQPRRRAAGAPPPLEAQQGAARAGRARCRSSTERRSRACRPPSASTSRSSARLLPGDGALRLHADAGRARRSSIACRGAGAGRARRSCRGHELLPRSRDAPDDRTGARWRPGERSSSRHVPQRADGDGFFGLPPNRVVELGTQIQL